MHGQVRTYTQPTGFSPRHQSLLALSLPPLLVAAGAGPVDSGEKMDGLCYVRPGVSKQVGGSWWVVTFSARARRTVSNSEKLLLYAHNKTKMHVQQ